MNKLALGFILFGLGIMLPASTEAHYLGSFCLIGLGTLIDEVYENA